MARFRKKPVEIEARQFLADEENGSSGNGVRLAEWCGGHVEGRGGDDDEYPTFKIVIPTLEGLITASHLDWIIEGVQGEYYPCKPDIFEATYEHCDEDQQRPWPGFGANGRPLDGGWR